MSEALIHSYYDAFNRGEREAMLSLLTDDVAHDINQGGREVGRDAFRSFLAHMDRCYREQLTDIVVMTSADGAHAAAEFVVHGTYLATDAGLPPARGPDLPAAGRDLLRATRRPRRARDHLLQPCRLEPLGRGRGVTTVRIERLTGERLRDLLPELARLRITVFRAFPYLYDGSLDYEQRYLRTYAEAADSVIVGAFDGETVVGASTGLPLAHEPAALTRPFVAHGFDVARVFYFGESVLLPAYRGHGIGVGFFREREAHVRSLGRFGHVAFCGVVRPPGHPRRPADYVPLDEFWRKRGFAPVDGMAGSISWRDLDEAEETAKPMQFWIKRLA